MPLRPRLAVLPIALCLVVSACAPADSTPPDPKHAAVGDPSGTTAATSSEPWVLMSWNVEFLWDGEAPEDGDADFPWKGDRQAARAHMQDLADLIREVDPDLIGLVEVESLKALETFNRDFLAGSGYEAHLVEGLDSATGQDVGLLSKVPVLSIDRDPRKGRSGSARKSVSKNYVAKLKLGDTKVAAVGLHFLARPERQNRVDPRQAQADAVAGMARDMAGQGRSLIVWGDFNDYDGDVPDHDASRPLSRVLSMIRAMDPNDPGDDLVNVADHLPQNQRYSVTFGRRDNRRKTLVDHILLSPDLAERIVDVQIPHDRPWRDASDHYPIIVHLRR